MMSSRHVLVTLGVVIFVVGFIAGTAWQPEVRAQSGGKVFELRTYTTAEGKLPNLEARFRDHTMGIFERHGMGERRLLGARGHSESADLHHLPR